MDRLGKIRSALLVSAGVAALACGALAQDTPPTLKSAEKPAARSAATVPAKKTTQKKKTATSATATSSKSAGGSHSSTSSHSKSSAANRKSSKQIASRRGKRKTVARGQQKIDPERAQEIQEALVREHYLSGGAVGTWNQASEAAMRRYQADHGWQSKTVPDARALISLGLGPSHDHLLNPESAMTTGPTASQAPPPVSTPGNSAPVTSPPPPTASSPPAAKVQPDSAPASPSNLDPSDPQ